MTGWPRIHRGRLVSPSWALGIKGVHQHSRSYINSSSFPSLSPSSSSFVYVTHMWFCVHALMWAHVEAKGLEWFSLLFSVLPWFKVSQDRKLPFLARLASWLVSSLYSVCLHGPMLESQVCTVTFSFLGGSWKSEFLSSSRLGKALTHWATFPALTCV